MTVRLLLQSSKLAKLAKIFSTALDKSPQAVYSNKENKQNLQKSLLGVSVYGNRTAILP